jgi:hypothetical protein
LLRFQTPSSFFPFTSCFSLNFFLLYRKGRQTSWRGRLYLPVNFNKVSMIKNFLSRSAQDSGFQKKRRSKYKEKEPQSSYQINLDGLKLFIKA